MLRRARVRVGDRRRREQLRNYLREQRQVEAQVARDNHDLSVDVPVDAAINELNELQLPHPAANDLHTLEADCPILLEGDGMIEDEPIQLPAPHHLGGMNNKCPHCGARYFQAGRMYYPAHLHKMLFSGEGLLASN